MVDSQEFNEVGPDYQKRIYYAFMFYIFKSIVFKYF